MNSTRVGVHRIAKLAPNEDLDGIQGSRVEERREADVEEGNEDRRVPRSIADLVESEQGADEVVPPARTPEHEVAPHDQHEGLDHRHLMLQRYHLPLGVRIQRARRIGHHLLTDHVHDPRVTEPEHADRNHVDEDEVHGSAELLHRRRGPGCHDRALPVDDAGRQETGRPGQQEGEDPSGCYGSVGHPFAEVVSVEDRVDDHEVAFDCYGNQVGRRDVVEGPHNELPVGEADAKDQIDGGVLVEESGELQKIGDGQEETGQRVDQKLDHQQLPVGDLTGVDHREEGDTVCC